jgi:hypothetical protein
MRLGRLQFPMWLLTAALFSSACTDAAPAGPSTAPGEPLQVPPQLAPTPVELSAAEADSLDVAIRQSAELRELLDIRDLLTQRLRQRGHNPQQVFQQRANPRALSGVFGLTPSEERDLNTRLTTARAALLARFPTASLVAEGKVIVPASCQPSRIDSRLERSGAEDGTLANEHGPIEGDPFDDPEFESDCRWLLYVASLALCTTTGPVLYWACAFVAWCSFCDGPAVTRLCNAL